MQLKRILQLATTLCNILFLQSTKAILSSNLGLSSHHQLWDIREKIKSCCFNPISSVLILFDNSSRDHFQFFNYEQTPSYIFGKDVKETLQNYQRFRDVYKLQPVHLSKKTRPASSVSIFLRENIDLSELLMSLQNSIWWNSRAKFFVLNSNISGCEMAQTILTNMWEFKILSVIYLCRNSKAQLVFYTFNPYSHLAPKFWTSLSTDVDKKWTLLSHTIEQIDELLQFDDSSLCGTLYFDKSANMNGHELRVYGLADTLEDEIVYDTKSVGYERCKLAKLHFMCSCIKSINATFIVKFFNYKGMLDPDGRPFEDTNEIFSGQLDLFLHYLFLRDFWFYQTYPYFNEEVLIVTSNHARYELHFFAIFKPAIWIFLSLLSVLTILSLKFVLKIPLVECTLEFLRMVRSSSTLKEPTRGFERVCFIILIYMWFILNIYIQSDYQADKIAFKQGKTIDSMDDLIDSGSTVYGLPNMREFITDQKLERRFVAKNSFRSSIESALSDKPSAFLIYSSLWNYYYYSNTSLHVSRDSFIERDVAWVFAKDSPLLAKFDSVMSRLNQAGIMKYYNALEDSISKRKNVLREVQFSVSEFIIAMRVLIGGWLLAFTIFASEIISGLLLRRIK